MGREGGTHTDVSTITFLSVKGAGVTSHILCLFFKLRLPLSLVLALKKKENEKGRKPGHRPKGCAASGWQRIVWTQHSS